MDEAKKLKNQLLEAGYVSIVDETDEKGYGQEIFNKEIMGTNIQVQVFVSKED